MSHQILSRKGAVAGKTIPTLGGALVTAVFFALFIWTPGLAAARDLAFTAPSKGAPSASPLRLSGPTIKRLQQGLGALGLYLGPMDGTHSISLDRAATAYARQAGLTLGERSAPKVLSIIERELRFKGLIDRLEGVRRRGKAQARGALLSHPKTRELLTGPDARPPRPPEGSNTEAASNTDRCLKAPSVRCLTRAALHAAHAVVKQDYRDWALGEILLAQAHTDQYQAALVTARGVSDPRLVMAALKGIASAEARAGRHGAALMAASMIPSTEHQIAALAVIAGLEIDANNKLRDDGVTGEVRHDALDLMVSMARRIDSVPLRVEAFSKAAVLFAAAGRPAKSERALAAARRLTQNQLSGREREVGSRRLSVAFSKTDDPETALETLADVRRPLERASGLMAAAAAQSRAGDFQAAKLTAARIQRIRYRVLSLAETARGEAESGKPGAALETLLTAEKALEHIRLPYARAYSQAMIARTLGAMAGRTARGSSHRAAAAKRALELARGLGNARLKAEVLSEFAASDSPFNARERDLDGEAEAAAEAIDTAFARAWMYAGLARSLNVSPDRAAKTFERALALAAEVDDPWQKARLLANLAETRFHLNRRGAGGSEPPPTTAAP